jgi:hypothetical protein
MDIFDYHAQKAAESTKPLAERMRPRNISEFVGQDHVVGALRVAAKQRWPALSPGKPGPILFIFLLCFPASKKYARLLQKPEINSKFTANERFCLLMKSIDLTKPSKMHFCTMWKAA